jgi:DNA-binding NtrC family response regulator
MNLLERLVVTHPGGVVDAADLEGVAGPEFERLGRTLAERPDRYQDRPESEVIASVLESTGGNVSRAARRLELARSTLRHKIKKYALEGLIPRD